MQRHEKLKIAEWAFRDISQAIERWQSTWRDGIKIDCGWEGKITVEDETFTASELRERDKDYD